MPFQPSAELLLRTKKTVRCQRGRQNSRDLESWLLKTEKEEQLSHRQHQVCPVSIQLEFKLEKGFWTWSLNTTYSLVDFSCSFNVRSHVKINLKRTFSKKVFRLFRFQTQSKQYLLSTNCELRINFRWKCCRIRSLNF